MKKIQQSLFALLLSFLCINSIYAQDVEDQSFGYTLTSEEKSMLQRRAAEKVGQMCDYISFVADKANYDRDTRLYYAEKALNLFIAQGRSYTETIGSQVIKRDGVLMEVTSASRNTKKSYLMREYLPRMADLKYASVKIQSTEVSNIKVSQLQKVGENLYTCTCYFDQAFAGMNGEGRPIYIDITRKKVECYVFAEDTEDGMEYTVLLGNVTALSTQRMSSLNDALNRIN